MVDKLKVLGKVIQQQKDASIAEEREEEIIRELTEKLRNDWNFDSDLKQYNWAQHTRAHINLLMEPDDGEDDSYTEDYVSTYEEEQDNQIN